MKLIVGLGNPGSKYFGTRHNVGFRVLNNLASQISKEFVEKKKFESEIIEVSEVILAKPTTFMNKSGEAVKKIRDFYKIHDQDIWVVHDDLDISLGEYKISEGKGPKDHNGIGSVEEKLGSRDFWHARVGIENRSGEDISGEQYVLMPFETQENVVIEEVVAELVNELKKRLDL